MLVLRTGFLTLVLLPMSGHAEGMIELKPYVSASMTYDDNLFRLSGSDQARSILKSDAMSDLITRTEAGISANLNISRQHLLAELNLNQNRYDRYNILDSNGNTKKIAWDWSFGNHLNGVLSMTEDKSMAGFTEIHDPVLNQRTNRLNLMSVNWDFHPSWRLHLQHDETSLENDLVAYRTANRKDVAQEVELQYNTSDNNRVGLSVRETETEYPNRDPFSMKLFGSRNHQRDLGLNVAWQLSGKTMINGRLGRVERTYEVFKQRDLTDWTGKLGLSWQPTGKTSLQANFTHDIYAVEDLVSTYVQSERITLNPTWMPTSKITVQGTLEYENRTYQGDSGFLVGKASPREDTLKTAGLVVSYSPYDKVQTQLALNKSIRDSSVVGTGYESNSISANVRINF